MTTMNANNATSLTLNPGWTNAAVTVTNSDNLAALNSINTGYALGGYWYPYYQPWWPSEYHHHHYNTTTVVEPAKRPIKLTMSEVERLRVAAKKDKQLRETLEKFTEHIEVIVDFPAK